MTLIELAERCDERADHMDADVRMLEIELASVEVESGHRWAAYNENRTALFMRNHRIFMDRLTSLRGSLRMCREDAEHYRACASALRSRTATGGQTDG